MGVWLGSVHASHYPRVTRYCGVNVSRLPVTVGVVSGDVTQYYGSQWKSDTIRDFLVDLLPRDLVLKVSFKA